MVRARVRGQVIDYSCKSPHIDRSVWVSVIVYPDVITTRQQQQQICIGVICHLSFPPILQLLSGPLLSFNFFA